MTSKERRFGISMCIVAGGLFALTTYRVSVDRREAPPKGDPAGSGRRKEDVLEILIAHQGGRCAPKNPCRDDAHWSVRLRGRAVGDPEQLRAALITEAEPSKGASGNAAISERRVVIRGSEAAPWGLVQRVMNECAKVGIYKIDWSASERSADGPALEVWLPQALGCDFALEIRVFMKWNPSDRATLRKVGNRGLVDSDEDLMSAILQMTQDNQTDSRTRVPVVVDATPDVPWKDVFHLVTLCRKENVKSVEFAAPFEKAGD